MFAAKMIAVGFIAMFAGCLLGIVAAKRGWVSTYRVSAWLVLAAALYFVAAGIALHFDWHDPLASATPQQIGQASGKARGRGWLLLLVIKFWPYVLMALGGYAAYHSFQSLRELTRRGW